MNMGLKHRLSSQQQVLNKNTALTHKELHISTILCFQELRCNKTNEHNNKVFIPKPFPVKDPWHWLLTVWKLKASPNNGFSLFLLHLLLWRAVKTVLLKRAKIIALQISRRFWHIISKHYWPSAIWCQACPALTALPFILRCVLFNSNLSFLFSKMMTLWHLVIKYLQFFLWAMVLLFIWRVVVTLIDIVQGFYKFTKLPIQMFLLSLSVMDSFELICLLYVHSFQMLHFKSFAKLSS